MGRIQLMVAPLLIALFVIGLSFYSKQAFDTRMNEDIAAMKLSLQAAGTPTDQVHALTRTLHHVTDNTAQSLSLVWSALITSVICLGVLLSQVERKTRSR